MAAEYEPRHSDGDGVLGAAEVGFILHGRRGLCTEILNDYLLHLAVPRVRLANGHDRLGTLAQVLTDTDQDARRQRNPHLAGVFKYLEPYRGLLVGRAVVHLALVGPQTVGRRLEHHAHRRGDRAEHRHLGGAHDPRVHVRKQAGLEQHQLGHLVHVVQGRLVAVLIEPGPGIGPSFLRAVAEGEQRLLAAHGRTLARHLEDLLWRHVERFAHLGELARGVDKDAVVAPVAAQGRDRQEDLFRERDDPGSPGRDEAFVTQPRGEVEHPLQIVARCVQQRFRIIDAERQAGYGPLECGMDRAGGCQSHSEPFGTW